MIAAATLWRSILVVTIFLLTSCAGLRVRVKIPTPLGPIVLEIDRVTGQTKVCGPPNTCVQLIDGEGNPVGDPIQLPARGCVDLVTVGVKGAESVDCPPSGGSGGSESVGSLSTGPLRHAQPLGLQVYDVWKMWFADDWSVAYVYDFTVRAPSFRVAKGLAADYGEMLLLDPAAAPNVSTNIAIHYYVAASSDGDTSTVYGVSQQMANEWALSVNGVVAPWNPQLDLPNGLWLSSSEVDLELLDPSPGAENTFQVTIEHEDCVEWCGTIEATLTNP